MSQTPQGHLSLKSSLYSVGNSKWITQRLVQDHMGVHYRKLINAKPAIDNKPPKSCSKSIKAQDTLRRKTDGKISRPASVTARSNAGSRAGSVVGHDIADDLNSIYSSRDLQNRKIGNSFEPPTWSPTSNNVTASRPHSSLSRSGLGGAGIVHKSGKHRQFAGDHLDNFAGRFSAGGDFQPRLLKNNNTRSWLSASKHYIQPRRKTGGSSMMEVTTAFDAFQKADTPAVSSAQESSSRPPTSRRPSDLKRERSGSVKRNIPMVSSQFLEDKSFAVSESNSVINASDDQNASERIKDDACLKFINEVTEDILNRNVSTNKAIENVMQEHYAKNKGKMSERSLQLALSSLREDLGLNETGQEKDSLISAHDHYYSPSRQTSITPRYSRSNSVNSSTYQSDWLMMRNDLKAHDNLAESEVKGKDLNKTVEELIDKIKALDSEHPSEANRLEGIQENPTNIPDEPSRIESETPVEKPLPLVPQNDSLQNDQIHAVEEIKYVSKSAEPVAEPDLSAEPAAKASEEAHLASKTSEEAHLASKTSEEAHIASKTSEEAQPTAKVSEEAATAKGEDISEQHSYAADYEEDFE